MPSSPVIIKVPLLSCSSSATAVPSEVVLNNFLVMGTSGCETVESVNFIVVFSLPLEELIRVPNTI